MCLKPKAAWKPVSQYTASFLTVLSLISLDLIPPFHIQLSIYPESEHLFPLIKALEEDTQPAFRGPPLKGVRGIEKTLFFVSNSTETSM